jgi:hypothetical protein
MQVCRCRLLLLAVALRDEQQDFVLSQRCLDGRQGCRAPDEKRDHYIRENDNIPKRQNRNPVRRRDGLVIALKDWQGLSG